MREFVQTVVSTGKSRTHFGRGLRVHWLYFALKSDTSERVCSPCGLKMINAAELYNFMKRSVSSDRSEGENIEAVEPDDDDDGRRTEWHLANP